MKAYIVRIWKDDNGQVGGHVSDPLTQERLVFANWVELCQILGSGFDNPAGVAMQSDAGLKSSVRKNDA